MKKGLPRNILLRYYLSVHCNINLLLLLHVLFCPSTINANNNNNNGKQNDNDIRISWQDGSITIPLQQEQQPNNTQQQFLPPNLQVNDSWTVYLSCALLQYDTSWPAFVFDRDVFYHIFNGHMITFHSNNPNYPKVIESRNVLVKQGVQHSVLCNESMAILFLRCHSQRNNNQKETNDFDVLSNNSSDNVLSLDDKALAMILASAKDQELFWFQEVTPQSNDNDTSNNSNNRLDIRSYETSIPILNAGSTTFQISLSPSSTGLLRTLQGQVIILSDTGSFQSHSNLSILAIVIQGSVATPASTCQPNQNPYFIIADDDNCDVIELPMGSSIILFPNQSYQFTRTNIDNNNPATLLLITSGDKTSDIVTKASSSTNGKDWNDIIQASVPCPLDPFVIHDEDMINVSILPRLIIQTYNCWTAGGCEDENNIISTNLVGYEIAEVATGVIGQRQQLEQQEVRQDYGDEVCFSYFQSKTTSTLTAKGNQYQDLSGCRRHCVNIGRTTRLTTYSRTESFTLDSARGGEADIVEINEVVVTIIDARNRPIATQLPPVSRSTASPSITPTTTIDNNSSSNVNSGGLLDYQKIIICTFLSFMIVCDII